MGIVYFSLLFFIITFFIYIQLIPIYSEIILPRMDISDMFEDKPQSSASGKPIQSVGNHNQKLITNQSNQSHSVNATYLYKTHSMVLSPNVKNLVILIPNEAHEPSSLKEQQLINQAFIPKHVKLHLGTKIVFFNADVDHDHHVVITKGVKGTEVFDTGILSYNDLDGYHDVKENSKLNNNYLEYKADELGKFYYYDTVDGPIIMNGTIQVVNSHVAMKSIDRSDDQLGFDITQSPENMFDTVGTFVVPTDTVNEYINYFKNEGLQIYDIHNFRNLMTNDIKAENSLFIWTSNKIPIDSIITKLKQITPTLPYS